MLKIDYKDMNIGGISHMKVLVDADACSRIKSITKICRKEKTELHVYHDIDHEYEDMDDYAQEHVVMVGDNSADYAILSACRRGDVVITRDIGLAAMLLAMKVTCLNDNGREYTERDIDNMLADRYMTMLEQENGIKRHDRGKWPRTKKKNFDTFLPKLIERERQRFLEVV